MFLSRNELFNTNDERCNDYTTTETQLIYTIF